jgi:hypothetical protein
MSKEYSGFLNGLLVKISEDTDSTEPHMRRAFCPMNMTEKQAQNLGLTENMPMEGNYDSGYVFKKPDGYYFRSYGHEILRVGLPERGQTKFIKTDIIPVPLPKGIRKTTQVRWYDGAWQKYSQTKGWISA